MTGERKMEKLLVWGASGHALVVTDIVRLSGQYRIVGFLDDLGGKEGPGEFCGLPVFRDRTALQELKADGLTHVILAFGNCSARLALGQVVRDHGLALATAIHPSAVVAGDASIGAGTVVAAGSIINPAVSLGENVIINTRASVDHECVIADGCHICPGVTLGGSVTVGTGTWVGIGSAVKDHVAIGSGSLIGAGSVVVSDIPDNVVAYGVPARVRKGR